MFPGYPPTWGISFNPRLFHHIFPRGTKAFTVEVTFNEVFSHNIKYKKLKDKTIRRRTNEYKNHIQPFFGHIKLKDLNVQHVMDLKTNLENHFDSLNSTRTVYGNFKILINHTVKFFGLEMDPSILVQPIKRVRSKINFIKREDFEDRVKN